MMSYFEEYYFGLARGISYLPTQVATIFAVVFLLNDTEWTVRGIAKKLAECLLCLAGTVLVTALVYSFFGDHQLDKIMLGLFTAFYACFLSKYTPRVKLVRSVVYIAGYMVVFSISEPIGELFKIINEQFWPWAQHLTWICVVVLLFGLVAFLRYFSTGRSSVVHPQFVLLLVVVSLLIVMSQILYLLFSGETLLNEIDQNYKQYNQAVSFFLLIIEMLTYYLYYSVVMVTQENEDLLMLRHKAEIEAEKFRANRVNYDDLRMLRHELKNHSFYMRSLLEAGKYEELSNYLKHTAHSELNLLQSFDCGNYMVDVVMNYAVNEARQRGVAVHPQIVVPHQLPYEETDMCSLLSNLMDNAIEAAAQSGVEVPSVDISILPRQDYLFIRVMNDVDQSIPVQQRLSLKTTKKQCSLHGYGTRVIRGVVEKYKGTVKFDMVDGRFVVDVMLELPRDGAEKEENI